jgi:hypothetical protein
MLKGYGIANLSLEFAIVGVMALLFLGLASLTVKDKITA